MISTLNENIKKLRISKGLNQVEFAKKLGVTKQCVSNWENDNVIPSIEMLVKMADFFGASTDYLLGRTEKRTIEVSKLTEQQINSITTIVKDLEKLKKI